MKRRASLIVILAVVPALVVGCGRTNPSPAPVVDKSGDNPSRTIVQLLKGLPAGKQPKPGPDGIIERNEAKTWLAANLVGKALEFSLRVGAVEIEDASDGKYNVELQFITNPESEEMKNLQSNVRISRIAVGKVPCEVQVWGPAPLWSDLDTTTAKKRRELKGKQVHFKARVTEAEFHEGDDAQKLLLMLGLTDVEAVRANDPPPVQIASVPEKTDPKQAASDTPTTVQPTEKNTQPKALPTAR